MRYVWLTYILILLFVNASVVWPLQGEPLSGQSDFHYEGNYRSSRMSKVCSFLAETCGKCTELKACFWCSDSGMAQGSCYARSDLYAKRRCTGKVLSYWGRPCRQATRDFYSSKDAERSVLIKLLLLLRKLRDSQNNPTKSTHTKSKSQENANKQNHVSLVDISNKDLRNKIVMLSNSTSSMNNTTIEKIVQNVSKIIGSKLENSMQHDKHKADNRSINTTTQPPNTTVASHYSKNITMGTTPVGLSTEKVVIEETLCNVYNRSSCARNQHSCTWCSNNATCCAWTKQGEAQVKKKIIVIGASQLSTNRTPHVLCTSSSSCETCVADISCYWCLQEAACYTYPGVSYVADECSGASHHKTCTKEMPVYVIALCIILITFFVSVGYLCVRKCYYFQLKPVEVKLEERPILFKQKNGRTVYQITESEEEDEEEYNRNGKDSYTPSKVGAAPNHPAVW